MPKIFIENFKQTINSNVALNLLNNFFINKVPIHTVCGGRAMCGCCRVKILSGIEGVSKLNEGELKKLGKELIDEGWRLSCQTFCLRDITLHVPTSEELDKLCSKN